jgi:plastocyanin
MATLWKNGWKHGARMIVAGVGAALLIQTGVLTEARAQENVDVDIQGFAYAPVTLTVSAGTTVTWTNHDPVAHTVTDIDQAWSSPLFEESGTFSKTFDTPGTYSYFCLPHAIMVGTVEVTP